MAPSVGLFAFISTGFRCKPSEGKAKRSVRRGGREGEEEEGNGLPSPPGPSSSLRLLLDFSAVLEGDLVPRVRVGSRASCKESSLNPAGLRKSVATKQQQQQLLRLDDIRIA